MKPGERIYNKATDKQWSSEVYHKAKEVIQKKLPATSGAVQFDSMCEPMKQQYPSLCLDNIKDPTNLQSPYWKHLVASATQALKKENKVYKTDNGWVWAGVKQPPSSPPDEPDKLAEQIKSLLEKLIGLAKKEEEKQPRLTHDELVQKIKEMGEMLGKIANVKWGPKYEYDCVWKDNPYANPKLVIEVCDKGNLYKDITSLNWAVTTWAAKGVWVIFDDSDFHKAKEMLGQESQIYPLKAEDVLKLHSLLQAGYAQAIRAMFSI